MGALLGNKQTHRMPTSGILGTGGAQNQSSAIAPIEIHGKANQVVYLREDDIRTTRYSAFPCSFLCHGGTAKVAYTLVNAARACNPNPDMQGNVPWVQEQTLTADTITTATVNSFSAIRVTFVSDCEFYVHGR